MLTNPFISAYLKDKQHYLAGNDVQYVEIDGDVIAVRIANSSLHCGYEYINIEMLDVMNWLWEQSQ